MATMPAPDAPITEWAKYARSHGIIVSDRVTVASIISTLQSEGVEGLPAVGRGGHNNRTGPGEINP